MKDFVKKALLALLGIEAFAKKEDGTVDLTQEQLTRMVATLGQKRADEFVAILNNPDEATPNVELTEAQARISSLEAELATAKEGSVEIANLNAEISALQETIKVLANAPELNPELNLNKDGDKNNDNTVALFGRTDDPACAYEGRHWNRKLKAKLEGLEYIGSSIDYSKLSSDLGTHYTQAQKVINSTIIAFKGIGSFIPNVTGKHNNEVLVNLWITEMTQAYQKGFTPKGEFKLEPEILKLYKVKLDHTFSELKELEDSWIDFVLQNNSSSMKMSFVQYIMSQVAIKLHNEREDRRMNGVRIEPDATIAGSAINGANGLRVVLTNAVNDFKLKEFEMGHPTVSNIVDYVYEMAMKVPRHAINHGNLFIGMSEIWKTHYNKKINALYGQDTVDSTLNDKIKFLSNVKIKGFPMGTSNRMFITFEGNLKTYERVKDEMYSMTFQQDKRELHVFSDWTEGIQFDVLGMHFSSASETDVNYQLVWLNNVDRPTDEYIKQIADDTTPSLKLYNQMESVANSGVTSITDFDDITVGQTIVFKCGSDTNASKILKAGNFADIASDWVPSKGDVIVLYVRSLTDITELYRTDASTDAETISADDTTPDVTAGLKHITSANSGATAITDFDNATAKTTLTIYGGSNTNASTIADSGKFNLTASMTLGLGTWIELYVTPELTFVELKRG